MYEFIKLCGNLCINVSFYLYIHFVVMKFFKHYMKNYHSSLNDNKCDIKIYNFTFMIMSTSLHVLMYQYKNV
jgi:hypothetical protein